MCGRYVSPDQAAIERAVEVQRRSWAARLDDGAPVAPFAANYNVAPTAPIPVVRVVREVDGQRESTIADVECKGETA